LYVVVITNHVSDYINLLVRIAHIICNYPYEVMMFDCLTSSASDCRRR